MNNTNERAPQHSTANGSPPNEFNIDNTQFSTENLSNKDFLGFSIQEEIQTNPSREAAHKLREVGVSTIAVNQNKKPNGRWKKHQTKIATHEEIERSFSQPDTCIAVVCGKVSGNLEALDFDNKAELLKSFCEKVEARSPGLILKLILQKSQNGGAHMFFRCPSIKTPGNIKLASRDGTCLIETRGEGGYILVAPSPGYELVHRSFDDIPELTLQERQILIDVAISLNQSTPGTPHAADQQACNKILAAHTLGSCLSPRDDFNSRGDFGKMLEEHGWIHAGNSTTNDGASVENYRRPGKTEGSSASILERNILYVFSTNASPFESGVSYSKFAVYSLLYCGGDNKQASAELRKQGYGKQTFQQPAKEPLLNRKALPGFAGRFVELACRNSEADPAAVLITLLARAAIELGNRIILMIGDTKHYCRIYGVVVGASSKARKGTSAKPVERFFDFIPNPAQVSPGPFSSGEGIISAVRDPVEKWKKPSKKSDVGYMYIDDPGVDDKRFFLLDEEFGSALTCMQREGNTLSVVLRCGWDNGDMDPLTKNSKIKATGAHFGFISHITKEELLNKLSKSESFNGFANRILWVYAKRQREIPFPVAMPKDEMRVLQDEFQEILNHSKTIKELERDESEKALWGSVYSDLTKDHPGLVGCSINRGEAQVLRLAMIYCLLDQSDIIRRSHLEAALALWDYCRDSAYYIFHGKSENSTSNQILDALKSGSKTTTELHQVFSNNLSSDLLSAGLSDLIASGKIIENRESTSGAPRKIYSLTTNKSNFVN